MCYMYCKKIFFDLSCKVICSEQKICKKMLWLWLLVHYLHQTSKLPIIADITNIPFHRYLCMYLFRSYEEYDNDNLQQRINSSVLINKPCASVYSAKCRQLHLLSCTRAPKHVHFSWMGEKFKSVHKADVELWSVIWTTSTWWQYCKSIHFSFRLYWYTSANRCRHSSTDYELQRCRYDKLCCSLLWSSYLLTWAKQHCPGEKQTVNEPRLLSAKSKTLLLQTLNCDLTSDI